MVTIEGKIATIQGKGVRDLIITAWDVENHLKLDDETPIEIRTNSQTVKTDANGNFLIEEDDKVLEKMFTETGERDPHIYFQVSTIDPTGKESILLNTKGWYEWKWERKKTEIWTPDKFESPVREPEELFNRGWIFELGKREPPPRDIEPTWKDSEIEMIPELIPTIPLKPFIPQFKFKKENFVLLPIKLEIRLVDPDNEEERDTEFADYGTLSDTNQRVDLKPLESMLSNNNTNKEKEYWIRWYPDDIHILTPIGKITSEEQKAWQPFQDFYNTSMSKMQEIEDEEARKRQTLKDLVEPFGAEMKEKFGGVRARQLAKKMIINNGLTSGGEWEARKRQALEDLVESFGAEMKEKFGVVRARQLAKNMIINNGLTPGGEWDFDTADETEEDPLDIFLNEGLPLPTLPEEIYLFTIKNGQIQPQNKPLAKVSINQDEVRISSSDISGSNWMTDFEEAERLGMGTRIFGDDKTSLIDEADWLIAFGIINPIQESSYQESLTNCLEEILKRRNAAGQLSIVAQDSPTNNTETAKSVHIELESDLKQYFKKTQDSVPNQNLPSLHTRTGRQVSSLRMAVRSQTPVSDAHILTQALGLEPSTLGEIEGADLKEQTEATAMAMLVWDACTLLAKNYWKETFPEYPEIELRFQSIKHFFIENVRARGNFPILRVGDKPYGVLPVILLGDCSLAKELSITSESSWNFIVARVLTDKTLDLVAIERTGTGPQPVELHVLSGESKFSERKMRAKTPLITDGEGLEFLMGDVNKDGHQDLVAVQKSGTKSGYTEVHVLSGKSKYNKQITQTRTPLGETDEGFQFLMGDINSDGHQDLVAIQKSGTKSKSTEVHVLSGESNYDEWIMKTNTPLGETDERFQFLLGDINSDGHQDLMAVKKSGTKSRFTEVYILSGKSEFKEWEIQTVTPLRETGERFQFLLGDVNNDGYQDLIAIKKAQIKSKSPEIIVLSGEMAFMTRVSRSDLQLPEILDSQKDDTENDYYKSTLELICRFSRFLKKEFINYEEDESCLSKEVPRLSPVKEKNTLEELLEVLRTTRISKRVDTRPFDPNDPFRMDQDPAFTVCPLVKEQKFDLFDPNNDELVQSNLEDEIAYLQTLAEMSIPDPTAIKLDEQALTDLPLGKQIDRTHNMMRVKIEGEDIMYLIDEGKARLIPSGVRNKLFVDGNWELDVIPAWVDTENAHPLATDAKVFWCNNDNKYYLLDLVESESAAIASSGATSSSGIGTAYTIGPGRRPILSDSNGSIYPFKSVPCLCTADIGGTALPLPPFHTILPSLHMKIIPTTINDIVVLIIENKGYYISKEFLTMLFKLDFPEEVEIENPINGMQGEIDLGFTKIDIDENNPVIIFPMLVKRPNTDEIYLVNNLLENNVNYLSPKWKRRITSHALTRYGFITENEENSLYFNDDATVTWPEVKDPIGYDFNGHIMMFEEDKEKKYLIDRGLAREIPDDVYSRLFNISEDRLFEVSEDSIPEEFPENRYGEPLPINAMLFSCWPNDVIYLLDHGLSIAQLLENNTTDNLVPIKRRIGSSDFPSAINDVIYQYNFNEDNIETCYCSENTPVGNPIKRSYNGYRIKIEDGDGVIINRLIDGDKLRTIPYDVYDQYFDDTVGVLSAHHNQDFLTNIFPTASPLPDFTKLVRCSKDAPLFFLDRFALRHVTPEGFNAYHFKVDSIIQIGHSPVLKRLIYYLLKTLDLNNWIPGVESDSGDIATFGEIKKAASILRDVHPDKLEILLVETLDLLTYRLDAWITGLAHQQIIETLDQNRQAPRVGVYGWLEKPGDFPVSSFENAEYIQAPSLAQANAAALLRNASLNRKKDNQSELDPYQINLSSNQVRKGSWYLEGLRQRHLPEELSGFQIERVIHDRVTDSTDTALEETDIYLLRKNFPLTLQQGMDGRSEEASGDNRTFVETVIHGNNFLGADEGELNTIYENDANKEAKVAAIKAVQDQVRQIQDAAADIALAEVVYQFMKGNTARTTAWLDFLDGNVLPPEPEFIRTHRIGDRVATKLFLLIQPPDTLPVGGAQQEFPRQIVAPIVSHLCVVLLNDFATTDITVTVQRGKNTSFELLMKPPAVFQFKAVDLVIGGEEELLQKTRYEVLHRWKNHDPISNPGSDLDYLKDYPHTSNVEEILTELTVTIKLENKHVQIAKLLRNLLHKNNPGGQGVSVEPKKELKFIQPQVQIEALDPLKSVKNLARRADTILKQLHSITEYLSIIKDQILILVGLQVLKGEILQIEGEMSKTQTDKLNKIASSLDDLKSKNEEFDNIFTALFPTPPIDNPNKFFSDCIKTIVDPYQSDPEQLIDSFSGELGQLILSLSTLLDGKSVTLQEKLRETSRYGFEKAMAPLPNMWFNSSHFNVIINDLLIYLQAKIQTLFDNITRLVSESGVEKTWTIETWILSSTATENDTNDPINIWLDKLTEGLVEGINTLDPAIPDDEKWLYKLNFVKERFLMSNLITILQEATDGKKLPIFIPYVLQTDDDGNIRDWNFDFNFTAPKNPPDALPALKQLNKVRRGVKTLTDLLALVDTTTSFNLYADMYRRPMDQAGIAEDQANQTKPKYGLTDYLYLAPSDSLTANCFTCLLIDDWVEFFPNPEQTETSSIAYRYDAPQVEAPNVIIYAAGIPMRQESAGLSIAGIIPEAIELMQIRMVGSDEVVGSNNLGRYFPALLFGPGLMGVDGKPPRRALFPSLSRFLYDYRSDSSFLYQPLGELTEEELGKLEGPGTIASRDPNPKIGGTDNV